MRAIFYQPTIFFDTHKKEAAFHKCDIFEGRRNLVSFPLNPIQVKAPFQQWGIVFIGDINPHSLGILSRFCVPRKIIIDNASSFKSKKMIAFCFKYQIKLGNSTAQYPQGNGMEESSNKSLMRIIKKLLQENKKSWHTKLIHAFRDEKISTKKSIGTSPFQLVYVSEVIYPISLSLPMMRLLQEEDTETHPTQRRMYQLVEL